MATSPGRMQTLLTMRTTTDFLRLPYDDYHQEVDYMSQMHNPAHPGEVLREWLSEISVTDAAEKLGVNRVTLTRLLSGAAGVSPDMDLRLAKALGTTPGLWYAMQGNYDMWQAKKKFRGTQVQVIVKNRPASINA